MRPLCGLVGLALVLLTVASILRTLVVPRGKPGTLMMRLWRAGRVALCVTLRPFPGYELRDAALSWLAPLTLLATLICWLGGLLIGYGLLLFALSGLPLAVAVREAGSSLFTLGFASTDRPHLSAVDFAAAASGPLVIALQISYLPTLYAAFNRREVEVSLLDARGGEPSWGPELLARAGLIGTVEQLADLYRLWERLAADIGESHANYPILMGFRSPKPYRSWIVGLLAVMDAAALHLALSPSTAPGEARLVLRAGFTALREIARATRIAYDPDPSPADPIILTFEEFGNGVGRAVTAGFVAERTAAEAWPHFAGWRVNYESIGYELCRRSDAVPALWTGPRDWPHRSIPPVRPEDRRPTGQVFHRGGPTTRPAGQR
ncbi:hypothetical protein Lfu02_70490 [Longispora fulva]|uniref:Uncharacterized protein n=1 Tax=Longispora fulva TaxID=619741 RepID=A0A8J7KIP0_9ACTN|nr:hypothetical protein [Longispora fulva]MBG6134406.1 hypothetical protein [Longispora fulva]GIG62677.1 hypothetical protein Lfu02_70490 [Longispora fulva]